MRPSAQALACCDRVVGLDVFEDETVRAVEAGRQAGPSSSTDDTKQIAADPFERCRATRNEPAFTALRERRYRTE